MDLSTIPRALKPALKKALDGGASFSDQEVIVPLKLLSESGLFAVLRCLAQPLCCPNCGHHEVERHGTPARKRRPVQQFRCLKPTCRGHRIKILGKFETKQWQRSKGPQVFTEYRGTPVEHSCFGAREWFAVWFWYYANRDQRLSITAIAEKLGYPTSSVWRFARKRLAYSKKIRKVSYYCYKPARIFERSRYYPQLKAEVIVRPGGDAGELNDLNLRITSGRDTPSPLSFWVASPRTRQPSSKSSSRSETTYQELDDPYEDYDSDPPEHDDWDDWG